LGKKKSKRRARLWMAVVFSEVVLAQSVNVRVNERIRADRVRLISPTGEQLGIKPFKEALEIARDQDLDLVEVASQADPPVCRIMDYGKFKYEQTQKAKRAKKHQSQVVIKEMKFRPKIEEHDFETKKKHVRRFLEAGSKVKITIMFRGRETTHAEIGRGILDRLAADVDDLATVEAQPKLDGRNMTMVLAPRAAIMAALKKE
jgi:translation initiation factor IF-3